MNADNIYDYLERLANLMRNETRHAGADHGLLPVQIEALHYLSLCNRYSDTSAGLAEYLGQNRGTVSQTITILENKDLLKKIPDARDKRTNHLKLTPTGIRLLNKTVPGPLLQKVCADLNPGQQSQISDQLAALLQAMQRANNLKSFGVCVSCKYNQEDDTGYYCCLTGEPLANDDVDLICREHEIR